VQAPAWKVWTALGTVYIVWGSTYLFIRLMVRTIPPLLGAGVRFVLAGALVCAFVALRRGLGALRFTPRQLVSVTVIGVLMPAGGNGIVTLAEKQVPSGMAALLIASVPLWVAIYRILDGQRVVGGTVAGLVLGFSGVALLLLPGGRPSGAHLAGILLVLLAAASWAGGTFLSPRIELPPDPFVNTGVSMFIGGVVLCVAGLAAGEAPDFVVSRFSTESIAGLVYLIFIGSIPAYYAYIWVLGHAPVSKVATYAYVNPVIAVFLGWVVLSEDVTATVLVGTVVIVASVAMIVRNESRRAAAAASSPAVSAGARAAPERQQ
jgi:drug/metabolite transporter (DMT)-like permease